MPSNNDIIIILPAYNEASVIEEVLAGIRKVGYPHICVVDDGSLDNTGERARYLGATVLQHPINRGAGAAAQTGIVYAFRHHFKYAVLMDSDGQHLPEDIHLLMKKMKQKGADIIVGNRFAKKNNNIPLKRRLYNRIANWFTNLFCKKNYADTQSGFRLLNRKALEVLRLKNRKFGFFSEMLITAEKKHLKIEEAPIQVLYTPYSMSKGQNLFEGIRTSRSILWHIVFKN